jgi:hypothetical protein
MNDTLSVHARAIMAGGILDDDNNRLALESLSKRRFWQRARQPEVNRAVIATKQLHWLPVGVRVVKNVACLSSLLTLKAICRPPLCRPPRTY